MIANVTIRRANDLPLEFFARVIWQESHFQPNAVGPITRSGQRAQGIAQFMPGTASERRLLDPFDPVQALPKSAEFLSELRNQFGNLGLAAADYRCYPAATGSPGRLSDTQRGVNMKFVSAAALALIGCLIGFNSANAQGAAMKTTPTTKILAIGTINPGFEQSQVFAVLPEEVRETVDLYLDGKIEQWYSLQGKPGVAFIINVTDPAVAHEMLEKLPLGKAHMMSFELIPIGPLNPLRFLQGMQPKP
jgi:hypothetical protein